MTMSAPSCARRCANACPMPAAAPEMTAILLWCDGMGAGSFLFGVRIVSVSSDELRHNGDTRRARAPSPLRGEGAHRAWIGAVSSLRSATFLHRLFEQRAGIVRRQAAETVGEAAADLEVLVVGRVGPAAAPFAETMRGEQRNHRLGHARALVAAV